MATNFPDVIPDTISMGIKYNTQINVSSLDGSVQTIEIPGARWVADLSFEGLEPHEGRVLAAFIASLRGASGRFYLYDFSHPAPRGTADVAGVITVNGADQSGSSINTAGWTPSASGVLLAGDYIQLDNFEVKMVMSNVNVDVNGNATIAFEPPIRSAPTNGSTITITNCKSIMLLDDDDTRWASDNPGLYTSISFSCVEAFA